MSSLACPGRILPLLLAALALSGCTERQPDERQAAMAAQIGRVPENIRPLSQFLEQARRIADGRVIDVELESDIGLDDDRGGGSRWVYEIEVLTDDHRVVEMEFDAVTGQLLEIDGAPWPAGIPGPQP